MPGFALEGMARQVERAPVNPLDKTTIVSIYPKKIVIENPTIQPCHYELEAGSVTKPSFLVVGSASWWRNILDMPSIEIPVHSLRIAESLVNDYINGVTGFQRDHAHPGLFTISGEIKNSEQIVKEFPLFIQTAERRQKQWYLNLVEVADVGWARTNGNPRAISDLARLAAEQLGIQGKAWMQDFNTMKLVQCPACGAMKKEQFPICQNCKTNVDEFLKTRK